MADWSAENATNAYLRTIKMGKRAKEPDASEFISALAAGNNSRLIVVACGGSADSTALALAAAAQQTGGEVICILPGADELKPSREMIGESAPEIKLVVGNAENLLAREYREADCVVVDCRIKNCEGILKTAKGGGRNAVVLGYNAFLVGSWKCHVGFGLDAYLLPIGEGLLVAGKAAEKDRRRCRRSRWVVKVDKFTGEEHVFRVVANSN